MTGVETDKGLIKCDQVIVGAGPWIKSFWDMLDLPNTISIKSEMGKCITIIPCGIIGC